MIDQQGGSIVNMSSNSGLYHPSAMRFTEYVVSKAGINGLTKAMALAFGPYVRVNAICPGWIRTDMVEEIEPELKQRILDETALARWGTPRDIADSAVFLASSEASFITGELLIVAGGRGACTGQRAAFPSTRRTPAMMSAGCGTEAFSRARLNGIGAFLPATRTIGASS